jgi:hypothetical protein
MIGEQLRKRKKKKKRTNELGICFAVVVEFFLPKSPDRMMHSLWLIWLCFDEEGGQ